MSGSGYTRQSASQIASGQQANLSAPFNNEYNAIQSAFDGTLGHLHDGSTGNGPTLNRTALTGITSSTGFVVAAGATTFAARSFVAPAAGFSITNGDGVSGNPTFALTNDLAALEGLASTGFAARTTTDTWAQRTLTGTSAEITVSNGDGVSGNPTFSLPSALTLTGKTITGGTYVNAAITSGTVTGITDLAVADGGTGASSASGARTNLGLVIGTDVQAYDAELAALAGLTSAADTLPYFTGSGTAAVTTLTSFARSLIDDADAATMRTTLGLAIGTNVQAYDAELAALAGLTSAADSLPYFTGSGTAALATLTSYGRSLIDDADAATARTTLGLVIGTNVQAYSSDLAALAGFSASTGIAARTSAGTWALRAVTGTANKIDVTNGDGVSGSPTITISSSYVGQNSITTLGTITTGVWTGTAIAVANGGTGATTASGARTNLGLVIGTDVQAYDAELAALAGLTSAADKLPYFTGSGTAAVTTLTSYIRTLLDDTDAATARATLGVSDTACTVQYFGSGSGTYTTPAGVKRIRIRMVGGGGGGAGSGTGGGTGGTGGTTTFGTSLLSCVGGTGGASNGAAGGAGGSASISSPATGFTVSGGYGQGAGTSTASDYTWGGMGAASPWGGGGYGSAGAVGGSGGNAVVYGAGGGGSGKGAITFGGAGGGAGGFIEAWIASPSASYSYAIGAAGTAGAAGTSGAVGGTGGSGFIIVEEFYNY